MPAGNAPLINRRSSNMQQRRPPNNQCRPKQRRPSRVRSGDYPDTFGIGLINYIGLLLITCAIRHDELFLKLNAMAVTDASLKTRFHIVPPMSPIYYFMAYCAAAIGCVFAVHWFSYRFSYLMICIGIFFGQLVSITQVLPIRQTVFIWHLTVASGSAFCFALPFYRMWKFVSVGWKSSLAAVLFASILYLTDDIVPWLWFKFFANHAKDRYKSFSIVFLLTNFVMMLIGVLLIVKFQRSKAPKTRTSRLRFTPPEEVRVVGFKWFSFTVLERTKVEGLSCGLFSRVIGSLAFPVLILNLVFVTFVPRVLASNFLADLFNSTNFPFKLEKDSFYNTQNLFIPVLAASTIFIFKLCGHWITNILFVICQGFLGTYLIVANLTERPSDLMVKALAIIITLCSNGILSYYLLLCDKIFKNQGAIVFSCVGIVIKTFDFLTVFYRPNFDKWLKDVTFQKAKLIIGGLHYTVLISLFFAYYLHKKIRMMNRALLGLNDEVEDLVNQSFMSTASDRYSSDCPIDQEIIVDVIIDDDCCGPQVTNVRIETGDEGCPMPEFG